MTEEKILKIKKCVIPFLLLIAIVICAIQIVKGVNQNREIQKNNLKENILFTRDTLKDLYSFDEEIEKAYLDCESQKVSLETDYCDLEANEYEVSHISMWDLSELNSEWYYTYFAVPMKYFRYIASTPQELSELLNASVANETIKKIVLSIDPYQLRENYYKSVYYSNETLPYEEYVTTYLLPVFEQNPEAIFEIYLPELSLSYLSEMSSDDVDRMLANWYTFSMWLHWYPNVRIAFMGAEEWVIANDSNYESKYELVDDVSQLVHLYLYAFDEYTVTPPELEILGSEIKRQIVTKENEKSTTNRNAKLVFYGDSMFAYRGKTSISISGIIANNTGAHIYDLSLGGTTATPITDNSFEAISGTATGKDSDRFSRYVKNDDEITFLIWYGSNDYFENMDVSDYETALVNGIEKIKSSYPNSNFLVISPYHVQELNPDKDILDYVDAAERAAKKEQAKFINMYEASGVTLENAKDKLEDFIHPTLNTNVELAQIITDNLFAE